MHLRNVSTICETLAQHGGQLQLFCSRLLQNSLCNKTIRTNNWRNTKRCDSPLNQLIFTFGFSQRSKSLTYIQVNLKLGGKSKKSRQLSSICQPCISQKPMSLYTASMQHQTFGFQDPVCNSSTKPQLWPTMDPRPYSFSTCQIYHYVV